MLTAYYGTTPSSTSVRCEFRPQHEVGRGYNVKVLLGGTLFEFVGSLYEGCTIIPLHSTSAVGFEQLLEVTEIPCSRMIYMNVHKLSPSRGHCTALIKKRLLGAALYPGGFLTQSSVGIRCPRSRVFLSLMSLFMLLVIPELYPLATRATLATHMVHNSSEVVAKALLLVLLQHNNGFLYELTESWATQAYLPEFGPLGPQFQPCMFTKCVLLNI